MELNCLSSYVPAPAFYVGTAFSGMVNGATVAPLADCEYDVIIKTSDIPGTGTVGDSQARHLPRDWGLSVCVCVSSARPGTCSLIMGLLCACVRLLSPARHLPRDFGGSCSL